MAMDFTFNTRVVDVSVALNALKLYRERDYKQAIVHLLNILDMEPNNWQARLMLGASYYHTGEYAASQRVFRFLYDKCPDQEFKNKAFEGLQAVNVKLTRQQDMPEEFGCYVERQPAKKLFAWLDEPAAQPAPAKVPNNRGFWGRAN